jgi:hypothetical protein
MEGMKLILFECVSKRVEQPAFRPAGADLKVRASTF